MGVVEAASPDAILVSLVMLLELGLTRSALSYGLSFAALSSTLVHVWLWHRGEIRSGQLSYPSIDSQLMEALSRTRVQLNDVHKWIHATKCRT